MLFTSRRSISTIVLFVCLICAAKAYSQTQTDNSGKFVNEGLTNVSVTNAAQVMSDAPPPEDCPGAPPCPTVLRSSIDTLETKLNLVNQNRFAVLYRPSKKTILSKLTLSIHKGYELKYQSEMKCQGCDSSFEPVDNKAANSITGYLFSPDERMQKVIDEYKDSPEKIFIIVKAEVEGDELRREDFFFVKKED